MVNHIPKGSNYWMSGHYRYSAVDPFITMLKVNCVIKTNFTKDLQENDHEMVIFL